MTPNQFAIVKEALKGSDCKVLLKSGREEFLHINSNTEYKTGLICTEDKFIVLGEVDTIKKIKSY